jgi:hypothetical protein
MFGKNKIRDNRICKNCKAVYEVKSGNKKHESGFCCVDCADAKIYSMLQQVLKNQKVIYQKLAQNGHR